MPTRQQTLKINDTDYEIGNIRFYDRNLVITSKDLRIFDFPLVSRVKVEDRSFSGDYLLMEILSTTAYVDGVAIEFMISGVTFK